MKSELLSPLFREKFEPTTSHYDTARCMISQRGEVWSVDDKLLILSELKRKSVSIVKLANYLDVKPGRLNKLVRAEKDGAVFSDLTHRPPKIDEIGCEKLQSTILAHIDSHIPLNKDEFYLKVIECAIDTDLRRGGDGLSVHIQPRTAMEYLEKITDSIGREQTTTTSITKPSHHEMQDNEDNDCMTVYNENLKSYNQLLRIIANMDAMQSDNGTNEETLVTVTNKEESCDNDAKSSPVSFGKKKLNSQQIESESVQPNKQLKSEFLSPLFREKFEPTTSHYDTVRCKISQRGEVWSVDDKLLILSELKRKSVSIVKLANYLDVKPGRLNKLVRAEKDGAVFSDLTHRPPKIDEIGCEKLQSTILAHNDSHIPLNKDEFYLKVIECAIDTDLRRGGDGLSVHIQPRTAMEYLEKITDSIGREQTTTASITKPSHHEMQDNDDNDCMFVVNENLKSYNQLLRIIANMDAMQSDNGTNEETLVTVTNKGESCDNDAKPSPVSFGKKKLNSQQIESESVQSNKRVRTCRHKAQHQDSIYSFY